MDEAAVLQAEQWLLADPIRFTEFNAAQLRLIHALDDPEAFLIIAAMGNGTGKTFGTMAVASALLFGTDHREFFSTLYRSWPYPRELRMMSTAAIVEDSGPIQSAMRLLWPRGRWEQSRGSGKGFYSQGRSYDAPGWPAWRWDVKSYNQSREEMAGPTKGLIVCSEPPPQDLFGETIARLRAGGRIIIEMTPLTAAGYLADLVDEGVLRGEDGRVVGKVILVRGDIEDNCRDHSPGGQLGHNDIQRVIASWPVEEREARKSGKFLSQAGRIYSLWGEVNEIDVLSAYHSDCWERRQVALSLVLDPHDRKPFAMAWFVHFPNGDKIVVAEWPDGSLPLFHHLASSPLSDIEDYRNLIHATDSELDQVPAWRWIDPNFGNAPKAGTDDNTVKTLFAAPCRRCRDVNHGAKCAHRIYFSDPPDSISDGHLLVRRAIGNPVEGVRPKLYALKSCQNFCYAMRHYGYAENKLLSKGLSEKPELVYKDFADLVRYDYLGGSCWRPQSVPAELPAMVRRGKGVHAT